MTNHSFFLYTFVVSNSPAERKVDAERHYLNYYLQIQNMEFDQEFVEYIIKGIVNNPDDVRTERTVDERGVLITLHINQEDMGYVIGRQGQTARSVRTLLKIVGAKNNARVNLKIYEPEGSRPPRRERREEETSHEEEETDTSVVENLSI